MFNPSRIVMIFELSIFFESFMLSEFIPNATFIIEKNIKHIFGIHRLKCKIKYISNDVQCSFIQPLK